MSAGRREMNPDLWQRAKAVFADVLAVAVAERGEALDRLCPGDLHLRSVVQEMLTSLDDDPDFMARPAVGTPTQTITYGRGSTTPIEDPEWEAPDLEPRYELISPLGEGGMGSVHLAIDRVLGREVAVKIAHADLRSDERAQACFRQEIVTSARLDHPNIIPLFDLGRDPDGHLAYVMRRVEGLALNEILARRREGEEGWTLKRLLSLFQQACLAVDYAHSRGVIHRDLKPANIMVGNFGELYVVDWGLAGSGEVAGKEGGHTTVRGTPAYMSPEQARGQRRLNPRSDVFALGAILHELVSGGKAFPGREIRSILERVQEGRFERGASWESVPAELRRIVENALRVDPKRRTPSARALHDEIVEYLEGTRDRERRLRAADAALEEARRSKGRHDRCRQEAESLGRQVRDREPEGWETIAHKKEFWKLEDEEKRAVEQAELALSESIDHLIEGLGQVPDHLEIRQTLAEIYWERFRTAEESRDTFKQRFFESSLRRLDLDEYGPRLGGEGVLQVRCVPPATRATIRRYGEKDRVLQARQPRELDPDPVEWSGIPMGSWQLTLEREGYRPIVAPVSIGRNETVRLEWRFRREDEFGEGFVQVPAGPAIFGGDAGTFAALPRSRPFVKEFFMARLPVTWEEYVEFLEEEFVRSPAAARKRLPRLAQDAEPAWQFDPDGGVITSRVPKERRERRRWPVFGINWNDANAYCRWRSRRDGRTYVLPTDHEWEKAARGTDGRTFPWGDRFDAAFCKNQGSTSGKAQPEPVGRYRRDTSPYGVRDLAGGIREWCQSWFDRANQLRLVRGGSWNFGEIGAHCAYRVGSHARTAYPFLGFRLVQRPDPRS